MSSTIIFMLVILSIFKSSISSEQQNIHWLSPFEFVFGKFLDVVYDNDGFVRQNAVISAKTNGHTLNRVRRQERLLCLGNEFITSFMNKLIEANRKNLKDWEPINMGDAVNIGIMDLRRGKAYGVANIFLQVSTLYLTLSRHYYYY